MRSMQQEAQLQEQLREKQRLDGEEEEMLMDKDKEPTAMSQPRTSKSQGKRKNRVQNDGSNLDRFFEHTTPVVPARFLPLIIVFCIPRSRNGRAGPLVKDTRAKCYTFSHIDQTRTDGDAPRRIGSSVLYLI
ncbi:hypothetical protein DY000_02009980 [Brassica cretica]|uniref:Uncharacterized protein n=1 Tax=Brassica cretica TaxID=69181 RepID=A0ABQ7CL79_BRACR|nr:hypothetical protein DY000_02009980 [Brassica cretica]